MPNLTSCFKILSTMLVSCAMSSNSFAAEVLVAVAANFAAPMQKIAPLFEKDTGHKVILSLGSTGSFYAQIKHGGPFHILLSADDETPRKLEKEGLGIADSRFTYATGKLVLWSKQAGKVDDAGQVLKTGNFQRIAIANPKLAPYGLAALETLTQLGVLQALQAKVVQGDNIAQTYQFVVTENAQLGFIALSQVYADGKIAQGSAWIVPSHLHSPLQQDALLLNPGKNNPAAEALMNYLKSDKAKNIMRAFGYAVQ
jgi:molybdate transport system substrate-binding protein